MSTDLSWYVFQREYSFDDEQTYWILDCHDRDIDDWMRRHEGQCMSNVGYGTLWKVPDRVFFEFVLRFPNPDAEPQWRASEDD